MLSCQWCGKPPLSMSNGGCNSVHRLYSLAGPQMASQTVGRTQASDIFRYSDIQISFEVRQDRTVCVQNCGLHCSCSEGFPHHWQENTSARGVEGSASGAYPIGRLPNLFSPSPNLPSSLSTLPAHPNHHLLYSTTAPLNSTGMINNGVSSPQHLSSSS